jgi:large subunit ribosomal protein L2
MLKPIRPRTAGQRHLVLPVVSELTRKGRKKIKPTKALLKKKKRTSGRNHHGHITCRHRGGGHKRFCRVVDFKREKEKVPAKVASIEYDPNRSAYVALLHYNDGEKRYILAPQGLKTGDTVATDDEGAYATGYCMRLKAMPLGSTVHNIELYPGRGGKFVRSAGLGAQLMARDAGYAMLKMPSGEVRLVNENCRATFGMVSNPEHSLREEGKAGRSRWKGIRPTVRGTAMNPVDHPHGGGEGKHNGYLPQTPWARYTKGYRTRSKRKSKALMIKDRRK